MQEREPGQRAAERTAGARLGQRLRIARIELRQERGDRVALESGRSILPDADGGIRHAPDPARIRLFACVCDRRLDPASAATLSIIADKLVYAPGETVTLTVVGDSEGAIADHLFG